MQDQKLYYTDVIVDSMILLKKTVSFQVLCYSIPGHKMVLCQVIMVALCCHDVPIVILLYGLSLCNTDSISNINCMMLQMNSPHICCDSDTGNFCPIQCNNGICMCVDETTGDPISDLRFPENAENINCDSKCLSL